MGTAEQMNKEFRMMKEKPRTVFFLATEHTALKRSVKIISEGNRRSRFTTEPERCIFYHEEDEVNEGKTF